jgi:hypothetical protein
VRLFFIATGHCGVVLVIRSLFWYSVSMTLQQTITIPADRRVHLDWTLPEVASVGTATVILDFPTVPDKRRAETHVPVHICHTLDEARSDAARKSAPEAREEFRRVMRETHGALEHSKAWGRGIDVVAEIRKIRNEWGDPWAEAEVCGSRQKQVATNE